MTRFWPWRRGAQLVGDGGGTVAVEFALISGALLLFTLGCIQVGVMVWAQGVLQTTAEATARCKAIASPNCPNAAQFAVNTANPLLFSGVVTTGNVTVTSNTSCNGVAGSYVVVTISTTHWSTVDMVASLSRATLTAQACYPVST